MGRTGRIRKPLKTAAELRGQLTLSPEEGAIVLGISRTKFYDEIMPLVRTGRIRSIKIGERRRIYTESLLAWAAAEAERSAA